MRGAARGPGVEVVLAPAAWRRRAEEQNEKFRRPIVEGRPFVLAKWAATLDGRIASAAGESRWITGERRAARALLLREEYDAMLVGAGTVARRRPAADAPARQEPRRRRTGGSCWTGGCASPKTRAVLRGPGRRLVVTARAGRASEGPAARRPGRRGLEPAGGTRRARGPRAACSRALARERRDEPDGRGRRRDALGLLPRGSGRPRRGLPRAARSSAAAARRRAWAAGASRLGEAPRALATSPSSGSAAICS